MKAGGHEAVAVYSLPGHIYEGHEGTLWARIGDCAGNKLTTWIYAEVFTIYQGDD